MHGNKGAENEILVTGGAMEVNIQNNKQFHHISVAGSLSYSTLYNRSPPECLVVS